MRGKRWSTKNSVFVGLLLLAMISVLEGASFIALAIRDGGRPSFTRWRHERERAAQQSRDSIFEDNQPRGIDPDGMQVIHPFVGFVLNPAFKGIPWREVTAQGFQRLPGEVAPPPDVPRFVVAVFGGSVAAGFCLQGRAAFVDALQRAPSVRGKAVVMRCLAMGGYKQPQQLMTLAYVLSLGDTIDVALNLDGFNEVVLPIVENLPGGVYPFYPRGWATRVAGAPTVDALRTVGRITLWKEERLHDSGVCATRPLAWSPTCHLLWTTRDRQLTRRVFEAERTLVSIAARDANFLARGPAFGSRPRADMCRLLAEHWVRSSSLMSDFSRARGIRYVHFLQPNQYVPGSKPMGPQERRVAVDPASPYKPPVEDCYPSLIEAGRTLAGRGVAFRDLTRVFASHPEPLYVDTCCHYNEGGHRLVGRAVGEVVVEALAMTAPVASRRSAD
jgi:hypothetical protein